MTADPKPLPCPRCKCRAMVFRSEARRHHGDARQWVAACARSGCSQRAVRAATESEAIAAWNTRKP